MFHVKHHLITFSIFIFRHIFHNPLNNSKRFICNMAYIHPIISTDDYHYQLKLIYCFTCNISQ